MKVGLLGGSFDPVHLGHLKLAEAARRQLKLDKVYLVLTPRSPFKKSQRPASLRDRLRMLRLAMKRKRGLKVGTWELKSRGVSYTVDTLKRFQKSHPSDQIFLIMGSDAWAGFRRWKSPDKIANLATLVVGRRPKTRKILQPKKFRASMKILRGTFPNVSSTVIRQDIKSGRSRKLLLPVVASYIQRHDLYR